MSTDSDQFDLQPASSCAFSTLPSPATGRLVFPYNQDDNFSFGQYVLGNSSDDVVVDGNVDVEYASEDHVDTVQVDLNVHYSDESLDELLHVQSTDRDIEIRIAIPDKGVSHQSQQRIPCISLMATITIPRRMHLDSLKIDSQSLTTRILPFIGSPEQSSSRRTCIHGVSDSTRGSYQLLDLLSIATVSGSIDVSVAPQPAEVSRPSQPAEFKGKSVSGSVNAVFPPAAMVPSRDYRTSVYSASGAVSGNYLLGSAAFFHTVSGRIEAALQLVESRVPSTLTAESSSGRISLRVLLAGNALTTQVRSTNGQVDLDFSNWEGTIKARTRNGAIDIRGAGVKLIRDGRGANGYREVEAVKGNGHSTIDVTTANGRVDVALA